MLVRRQEPVNPCATTIPSDVGPGSWWAWIGTPSEVVSMVVIMVAPDVIGSIIARLSRHATSTGGPTTRITHALAEGVSALRGGRRWPLRGPGARWVRRTTNRGTNLLSGLYSDIPVWRRRWTWVDWGGMLRHAMSRHAARWSG